LLDLLTWRQICCPGTTQCWGPWDSAPAASMSEALPALYL
jgi:hypothetical protein